jgi:integrase
MIRTRNGLPKHCSWNTDHHGKRRVRFRKNGFSTYLLGIPWSEDFMRQYAAALEAGAAQASNVGADRTKPGTVNALVVAYLASPPFNKGKPETVRVRRHILERFREAHGDKPLFRFERNGERTMLLTRQHVQFIVNEKAATPSAQRNFLHTLRAMFKWAHGEGRVPDDPTLGVTREKIKTTGWKTWSEAEIERFEAKHPISTRARLAFALLLYTGQWRGDIVTMGRHLIHNGVLIIDQGKTEGGEEAHLEIPVHPKLREIIEATPTVGRQDVPGDELRQAVHVRRLRQLVPRTVRSGRLPRRIGARLAQGDGAPARRDLMQRASHCIDHRTCVDRRGAALHQSGRSQAPRTRGDEEAGRGWMVTLASS